MTVHRWTDFKTGEQFDFSTEQCLSVLGLAVDAATEHIKRLHVLLISKDSEVGAPSSPFIRPHERNLKTMSLEQKIEELTHAVTALTEHLRGSTKLTTPVGKDNEAGKPAGKPKAEKPAEPAITIEELKSLAAQVKDRFDVATAKAIIKSAGKAEKTDQVDKANFAALKAALEAQLADDSEGDDESV